MRMKRVLGNCKTGMMRAERKAEVKCSTLFTAFRTERFKRVERDGKGGKEHKHKHIKFNRES